MLDREAGGDLLEARDRGGVALREKAQRPDRRQERFTGSERKQHPDIAVAPHPVETGEPQPELPPFVGEPALELVDRRFGGGGALLGDRLRGRCLRHLLRLQLELELEPVEVAGDPRRRLLYRLEARLETRDLAADRFQLLLARRGGVLGRRSSRQGGEKRQREQRGGSPHRPPGVSGPATRLRPSSFAVAGTS